MVRAHLKQSTVSSSQPERISSATSGRPGQSEEKKETPRRKAPIKRRTAVTGVWPCKINGCNKQFAREADLKRHQRTTKLHSVPGFACPQCDATFTRTDALRRHQKSRHNGVIIEPNENGEEMVNDDEQIEGEDMVVCDSQSRSVSPGGKAKEKQARPSRPSALAQSGTPGPSGLYYRQHTTSSGAFITSTLRHSPPGMIDSQFTQQSVALPTSATRLHQANWGPSGPWNSDGPPPSHVGAYHPGMPGNVYLQSQAFYRSLPQHQLHSNSELANGPVSQGATGSSPSQPSPDELSATQNDHDPKPDIEMAPHENSPSAPVIDPSLEDDPRPTSTEKSDTEAQLLSLQITQAAVEAVLESARQAQAAGVAAAIVSAVKAAASDGLEDGLSKRNPGNSGLEDGDADAEGEVDVERTELSTSPNANMSKVESLRPENGQTPINALYAEELLALISKTGTLATQPGS